MVNNEKDNFFCIFLELFSQLFFILARILSLLSKSYIINMMALLHFTISRLLIIFVPGEIYSNIISIVSGLIRNNKCIRSKSCCNRNEIICFMSVWTIQFVYSSSDEFSLSIGSVILKKCKLWDDFFQFLGANIFV